MPKTAIKISSADHGRQMSLADFDTAETVDGKHYELGRGIVTVTDVPGKQHFRLLLALRRQLSRYEEMHPDEIYGILGGSDCKLLIPPLNSERHPDIAVYKTDPPENPAMLWSAWIPDLLVEIVSSGSEHRDYVEKREEYLQFGVREYWIVDAAKQELLALQCSRGQWAETVVRPGTPYRPVVLPGFELDLAAVFAAK